MNYTIQVSVNKRAKNLKSSILEKQTHTRRTLYIGNVHFIHSCFSVIFVCFFFTIINHFLGRIVVRLIVHVTDCLADETNNKVHNVRNRVQSRLVTEY